MLYSLGIGTSLLLGFGVGFSSATITFIFIRLYWLFNLEPKNRRCQNYLKNGLLTHALVTTWKDKFEKTLYAGPLDGTVLPSLAGSNLRDACLGYIYNPIRFWWSSPMYSEGYRQKLEAIEKFIDGHLSTEKDVETFFKDYLDTLDKGRIVIARKV